MHCMTRLGTAMERWWRIFLGASINAMDMLLGGTPLHSAAEVGNTEMVQLLMLKGADIDAKDSTSGFSPLFEAVCAGHVATTLALLAGGADVSIGTSELSVVHEAAGNGDVDILRAVIEYGADVNHVITSQTSALHCAAYNNQAQAIDVLIKAGAIIEARDSSGRTPLHHASTCDSFEALTALLRHGAHVNAQDDDLRTPLNSAAAEAGTKGAAEVVNHLLRSGADETILDVEGKTAAEIVAIAVEEERRLAEDVERVRKLLANASVDRAWRRRGYLVMCRAHPERVQHFQANSSAHAGIARRTRHDTELQRSGASSCSDGVGAILDEAVAGKWACAVTRVLGLQEEGIFRTIVEYL